MENERQGKPGPEQELARIRADAAWQLARGADPFDVVTTAGTRLAKAGVSEPCAVALLRDLLPAGYDHMGKYQARYRLHPESYPRPAPVHVPRTPPPTAAADRRAGGEGVAGILATALADNPELLRPALLDVLAPGIGAMIGDAMADHLREARHGR